jgi:hypothetical protein
LLGFSSARNANLASLARDEHELCAKADFDNYASILTKWVCDVTGFPWEQATRASPTKLLLPIRMSRNHCMDQTPYGPAQIQGALRRLSGEGIVVETEKYLISSAWLDDHIRGSRGFDHCSPQSESRDDVSLSQLRAKLSIHGDINKCEIIRWNKGDWRESLPF